MLSRRFGSSYAGRNAGLELESMTLPALPECEADAARDDVSPSLTHHFGRDGLISCQLLMNDER